MSPGFRKFLMVSSAAFVALMVLGLLMPRPKPEPTMPAPAPAPVMTLKAEEVAQIYSDNEVRGDANFKDRTFGIEGVVASVGVDILGSPYILLRGGPEAGIVGVQCVFPRDAKDSLAQVVKNQRVRVVGRVSGKVLTSVVVQDCRW